MKTMNRMARIGFGLAAALIVSAERQAAALGERDGQIRGRVTEASTGAPVPGALVTANSPALIGPDESVTTDENGDYLLPHLPPGVYTVKVSIEGVKPLTHKVVVEIARTTPLDIQWSVELASQETTVVQEERHPTNPDSTQTGTVLSVDNEKYLPTGRSYNNVILQVPGVVYNPSFGDDPSVKGGRKAHNRYLIDGLDITDPVGRTATQLLAFDSIDSIQVVTGGFDAQYNVFGGLVNIISREGSDEFHGRASFYLTNDAINNRKQYGATFYDQQQPFNDNPFSPSQTYRVAGQVGGPILKHRLWFNVSFEFRYAESGRLIGPALNVPHVSRTDYTYLPRLKLSWAPSSYQRITISAAGDPQIQNNTNGSNSRLSTYEHHNNPGGYNVIATWSVFPNPNFEFSLDTGMKYQGDDSGPQGWFGRVDTRGCDRFSSINCTYDRERQIHVNNDDGTVWGNDDASYNTDKKYNFQFDPTVKLRGHFVGQHEAKAGFQLKMTFRKQLQHRPGIVRYVDQGGGASEAGLCDPEGDTAGCNTRSSVQDRNIRNRGLFPGGFVQDKWSPVPWLTIIPGLRYDYGEARLTDGSIYTAVQAWGPRLGVIVDLTRDQKTILSANYGRSNEVQEIGNASDWDVRLQGDTVTERFDRATGRWVIQTTTGDSILNKHPKPSHSDDITATLRREIFRNTLAALEYTWRKAQNTPETTEINRIWDITGYRVIGYRDGINHTVTYYDNPDRSLRVYNGFTLSVESQPTPSFYVLGFYTLSWLYGTLDSGGQNTGNLDIPRNDKFLQGFLTEDHRHQLHVSTFYKFHGLVVGAAFEYLSGAPGIGKKGMNQARGGSPNYLSPRGTEPGLCTGSAVAPNSPATTECGNDINKVSEFRVPDSYLMDLHLEYDLSQLLRQHIIFSADVFNVFSSRPATGFATENDTKAGNFGQAGGRAGNFNARLGARYEF